MNAKSRDDRHPQHELGEKLKAYVDACGTLRKAAERLEVAPSTLSGTLRPYKLKHESILRPLTHYRDPEHPELAAQIAALAREVLAAQGKSVHDFDLIVAGLQLQMLGMSAHVASVLDDKVSVEERRSALINEMLYIFRKAAFFCELAQARRDWRRTCPVPPFGSVHETHFSFENPEDNAENYVAAHMGGNFSWKFAEELTFESDRRRQELSSFFIKFAGREEPFLEERLENLAQIAHSSNPEGCEDRLTAAFAAAEGLVLFGGLLNSTNTLRESITRDRLLFANPLGRIALTLHKICQHEIERASALFSETLTALPTEHKLSRERLRAHVTSTALEMEMPERVFLASDGKLRRLDPEGSGRLIDVGSAALEVGGG